MCRKALTESTKKWVEKLKREDVPVLVCFSFADRLFIELQEKYEEKHKQSPPEGIFHEEIKQQLLVNSYIASQYVLCQQYIQGV